MRTMRMSFADLERMPGVPEYWLVDPAAETIEVHVLERGGYALDGVRQRGETPTSRVAQGLTFTVARAFER